MSHNGNEDGPVDPLRSPFAVNSGPRPTDEVHSGVPFNPQPFHPEAAARHALSLDPGLERTSRQSNAATQARQSRNLTDDSDYQSSTGADELARVRHPQGHFQQSGTTVPQGQLAHAQVNLGYSDSRSPHYQLTSQRDFTAAEPSHHSSTARHGEPSASRISPHATTGDPTTSELDTYQACTSPSSSTSPDKPQGNGYNANFVNPLSDNLRCSFCQMALRDPVQSTTCGHRYCEKCVKPSLDR